MKMWRAKHDFLGGKREREKKECQRLIRGPVNTHDGHGEREGWDESNDAVESFFLPPYAKAHTARKAVE